MRIFLCQIAHRIPRVIPQKIQKGFIYDQPLTSAFHFFQQMREFIARHEASGRVIRIPQNNAVRYWKRRRQFLPIQPERFLRFQLKITYFAAGSQRGPLIFAERRNRQQNALGAYSLKKQIKQLCRAVSEDQLILGKVVCLRQGRFEFLRIRIRIMHHRADMIRHRLICLIGQSQRINIRGKIHPPPLLRRFPINISPMFKCFQNDPSFLSRCNQN